MIIPKLQLIELHKLYSAPHRYYHNMNHVSKVITYLSELVEDIQDWQIAAIYYHDAIYNIGEKDNEKRSAVLFREHYANLRIFTMAEQDEIINAICGTEYYDRDLYNNEFSFDVMYILDSDLAGLGENFDIFMLNRENIEKEFLTVYSPEDVKKGTIEFYEKMLEKHSIYNTPEGMRLWENNARYNIKKALYELKST